MADFTLRYRCIPSSNERTAVDAAAERSGATVTWELHEPLQRAYALVERTDDASRRAISADASGDSIETAVIALAISPALAEALPYLEAALGGPGRPDGVVGCEIARSAAIVEWNLERTPAALILDIIRTELRRFGGGSRQELLSPIPVAWWTAIAGEGLNCPELRPDRVLESLIAERHVVR